MIPYVYSLEEARDWFLSHSSGSVMCQKPDGSKKMVDCYPDAAAFYGN